MGRFVLSAFADEIADDLKTQMDVLDEHGIKYIEIRGVNGKNITDHSLDEARAIKRQLDARGFKISAVGSPIGKIKITDDFAPHLELFKHTIRIARILETKYVRMFSFYMPEKEEHSKYRNEVLKRWKEFIAEAEGWGLTLLHENEKDIYGDTPERCLDLFETLKCNFMGAVFDPANFIQCGVKTYPEAYMLLKDHIEYMHIKDALCKDHSVVPAGLGDGRVSDILADLYGNGFDGFLSIEPHLGSFKGFAELELNVKINAKISEMPDGGPKLFAAACEALKRIIAEIGARVE